MECSKDRLWGTGVPLTQDDCLNRDRWISPGIMGKILEDIRTEFCNQFDPEHHSLNGIQSNPLDPPGTILCQAIQSHLNSGPSTHSMLSSVVQPNPTSQTTDDLPFPPSSSLTDDDASGPRPRMSQRVTTFSELQTQSHTVATTEAKDHSVATPMDHLEPMDSHGSDTISAELANPPGN